MERSTEKKINKKLEKKKSPTIKKKGVQKVI